VKTKTLEQTATFKASPMAVYEMLMDSQKHTSLSGVKAEISRNVGGAFSAWGGHLTGFNLVLKPGEKIVQAWRATGWWPDHYSVVIFDIKKTKTGSKVKFTQIGIPPNRYSGHYRGWIETYWTPMKELLEKGELNNKTRARIEADTGRIKASHFRRKISNKT
jgi:activator of HSP90 ATPase